MSSRVTLSVLFAASLASGPLASAQDASLSNARYCGLGYSGASVEFQKNNPYVAKLLGDIKRRAAYNNRLFEIAKASNWKINLYNKDDTAGKGASLGLSHVVSFEQSEVQEFVDPRSGSRKFSTSYRVGLNTVLFDLNDRQIKALIPSVIVYPVVSSAPPTPAQSTAAIAAIFDGIGDPNSAIGRWMDSVKRLTIRSDEKVYFRVLPLVLSDDTRTELAAVSAQPADTPGLFVKTLTSEVESLVASTFGKPLVPQATNDAGMAAGGNQYVANIPDCLGQNVKLILPPPSYQIQIYVDKLKSARYQHTLDSIPSLPSRGTLQTEIGYGGRFRAEVSEYVDDPSGGGGKVIDSRTFKFSKSLRFSGDRTVSGYSEYQKLTSNFARELLEAYTTQDKKWIKNSLSTTVVDKKQKDVGQISKDWKTLFTQRLGIAAVVKPKDAATTAAADTQNRNGSSQ